MRRCACVLVLLVAVVHSQTTTRAPDNPLPLVCPSGWYQIPPLPSPYCYKLFTLPREYADAQLQCERYGANLVRIYGYEEGKDVGESVVNSAVDRWWCGLKTQGMNGYAASWTDGSNGSLVQGFWDNQNPENNSSSMCITLGSASDSRLPYQYSFEQEHCQELLPYVCETQACLEEQFRCDDGTCVHRDYVCDLHIDCPDASDELNCNGSASLFPCTERLLGSSGMITSPEGDVSGEYDSDLACIWTIIGTPDTFVRLNFTKFKTEAKVDIVDIFIGSPTELGGTLLISLSGDLDIEDLPPLYSSNNFMILKFYSDSSVELCGFEAYWDTVATLPDGGTALTAISTHQYFVSPLYPQVLPAGLRQVWTISTGTSEVVTILVNDMSLAGASYVEIRDGSSPADMLLARYDAYNQGSNVDPVIFSSTGSTVRVYLRSEGAQFLNPGFNITYYSGCDVVLVAESGIIRSPGFPSPGYSANLDCSWTISTPDGRRLAVSFDDVRLADTNDEIVSYDGASSSGTEVSRTASGTAPLAVSTGDTIHVQFTTDGLNNSDGFSATFASRCVDPEFDNITTVLTNASGGVAEFDYTQTIHVSCIDGYILAQEPYNASDYAVMTCGFRGWETQMWPECEAQCCGEPPMVDHGYVVNSTGSTFGETITYGCFNGFLMDLPGNDTIQCASSGHWTTPPVCRPAPCGDIGGNVTNGNFTVVEGDGINFGTIVQLICDEGYEVAGVPLLLCTEDGSWSHDLPTCQPRCCYVPTIWHGVTSVSSAFVGDEVTVTCDAGYQPQGNISVMTCGTDRIAAPKVVCEDIDECPDACDAQRANCTNTEGSYLCVCIEGYQLSENETSTCDDVDECLDNPCDQTNGNCTNTVGSYMCNCNDGFDLYLYDGMNGFNIPAPETGMMAGDIYHIDHTCVPQNCSALDPIMNGVLLTGQTEFYTGDTATIFCDLGYVLDGVDTITCLQDGVWSDTFGNCTEAYCYPPDLNMLTYPPDISPMVVPFGDSVTLNCTIGRSEPLELYRECVYDSSTQNYTYSLDSNLECPVVDCGNLTVPNAMVSCPDTIYGTMCDVTCDAGYAQQGNATFFCDEVTGQGVWDQGDFLCVRADFCEDPGLPYGCTDRNITDATFELGAVVTYFCTCPGYNLTDGVLTCMNTTLWDYPAPNCTDIEPPVFTNCDNDIININRYSSFDMEGIPFPSATDNSNVLKSFVIYPPGIYSNASLNGNDNGTMVTITAEDYAGNMAECEFTLVVEGCPAPPNITCPGPQNITTFQTLMDIGATFMSSGIEWYGDLTFDPASWTFPAEGSVLLVTASASVSGHMPATCQFHITAIIDGCTNDALGMPANGSATCSASDECLLSCTTGYFTLEASEPVSTDDLSTTINANCTDGVWAPYAVAPDCVEPSVELRMRRTVYRIDYTIDSGCTSNPESAIVTMLDDTTGAAIAADLQEQAHNNLMANVNVTYDGTVEVQVNTMTNEVIVYVVMVLEPVDMDNAGYAQLEGFVNTALNYRPRLAPGIYDVSVTGMPPCDVTVQDTPNSVNSTEDSCPPGYIYVTDTAAADPADFCLPCAAGSMYDNSTGVALCMLCPEGTYQDQSGQDFCHMCVNDTTSSPGSKSAEACINNDFSCPDNMVYDPFDLWPGDFPKCERCPKDMYRMNETDCDMCPMGDETIGSQGAASVMECYTPCEAFEYSDTGLNVTGCTYCPSNFESDVTRQCCVECPFDQMSNGSFCVQVSVDATSCMDFGSMSGGFVQDHDSYYCSGCDPGFLEPYCAPENFCALDACTYGTCVEDMDGFNCTCMTGTSGDDCSTKVLECAADPCMNGGICEEMINAFMCHCPVGYTGEDCSVVMSDACSTVNCENGGTCMNETFSAWCLCAPGYTGQYCETDIDECASNPCLFGGNCTDAVDGYMCDCVDGTSGTRCEVLTLCMPDTCAATGLCVMDYIQLMNLCVCNDNYERDPATSVMGSWAAGIDSVSYGACQATDLCAGLNCQNGGMCTLWPLACNCTDGYTGSICQHDEDNCDPDPCSGAGQCVDGIDSYSCVCDDGWTGPDCDQVVDLCANQTCSGNGNCTLEAPGEYRCGCVEGYTGKDCEIEIDNCQSCPCLHGGNCTSHVGGYMCACTEGYFGTHCEEIINTCTNDTSACVSGANCKSLFLDVFCECQGTSFGDDCSEEPTVCDKFDFCQGRGNCLEPTNSTALSCACDEDYFGDCCAYSYNLCDIEGYCQNNGTCVSTRDGFQCLCTLDYEGDRCETSLDNCANVTCGNASQCIDGFDDSFCLCQSNFIGEDCTKAYDPDFTLYFYWQTGANCAITPKPFVLNTGCSGLTVGLWVRFWEMGGQGMIFTLYGFSDINDPGRDARILLTIDHENVTLFFDESSPPEVCPYGLTDPVNGAENYDHILVLWDKTTGMITIRINTIAVNLDIIGYAVGYQLPQYGMVVLGAAYDVAAMAPDLSFPSFLGEISMVYIWNRTLSDTEIVEIFEGPLSLPAESALILRWAEYELKGGVIVIRSNTICIQADSDFPSCDNPPTMRVPPMLRCPADPFLVPSAVRQTLVEWEEPVFNHMASVFTPEPLYLNNQRYLWGRYRNAYLLRNTDGRASVCAFDFFVQPEEMGEVCSDPQRPRNGDFATNSALFDNFEIAIPTCDPGTAFSIPTPNFYTCGPQGAYNVDNLFLEFNMPACAGATSPTVEVMIDITYTSIDNCNSINTNMQIEQRLLQKLEDLNNNYLELICGGSCCVTPACETPIDGVIITVTCARPPFGRRRLLQNDHVIVNIMILNLPLELCTDEEMTDCTPTSDVLSGSLSQLLNLPTVIGATASLGDTNLTATQNCGPQAVLVNNYCVVCAVGQYYDADSDRCEFCEIGYYNDMENQTECTACPSGNTTELMGSTNASSCYANCSAGFENLNDIYNCEPCDFGFYQPFPGQFFCYPCEVGMTTLYENSTSVDDCYDICAENGTEAMFVNGSATCVNCSLGTYRTAGSNLTRVCVPCMMRDNSAWTTPYEGSSSEADCTVRLCTRGYFYNETSDMCVKCEKGSYMDMMNHRERNCTLCDENYTTRAEGSTNSSTCLFFCEAGYEEDTSLNETCTLCPIGEYKDNAEPGQTCQLCRMFYTTPDEGSISQDNCTIRECDPGYKANNANDGCDECPYGEYQPDENQVECLPCPNNTSTREMGAVNMTQCEEYCPSGHEDINGTCFPCKRGFYRNNMDMASVFDLCEMCDINYITAAEGAEFVSECDVGNCTEGEYTLPNGTCALCPLGTYQDMWWQYNCTECPDGMNGPQTTVELGAKSDSQCVLDCPSGYGFDGVDDCFECDVGYYRARGIDPNCTLCDTDYITDGMGAVSVLNCSIANCSAGQFLDESMNKCELCPQGTFQSEKWQTDCIRCNDTYTTFNNGSMASSDCILEDSCLAGRDDCAEPDDGGICIFDRAAPLWFRCDCQAGFSGPGTNCTHLCDLGFCQNGGTCNDTNLAEPTCICPEFYTGDHCENREVPPSNLPLILGASIGGFVGLLALILMTVLFCWCCRTPAGATTQALANAGTVGTRLGPNPTYLGPVSDTLGARMNLPPAENPTQTAARSVAGYSNYKVEKPKFYFYEDKDDASYVLGPGIKYKSGDIYNIETDDPYTSYSSRMQGPRS